MEASPGSEQDERPKIEANSFNDVNDRAPPPAILSCPIHSSLTGSGRFELVISVDVSKNPDVRKVQEEIAVRLGYSRPEEGQGPTLPRHLEDRASTLLTALSRRKFLLLLDDLWEKLDLGAVGVPFSSLRNGRKIVFTTRSLEVCTDMEAQRKLKVPHLEPASSWKLFCQKLGGGEEQWDPSIRLVAEAVCKKCGGLPISLITVGRAMAGATTPGEWKGALKRLEGVPAELRGTKDEVLTRLKFSFDKLTGPPKGVPSLLRPLPRGEGLLESGRDSIDEARDLGRTAITSLKAACLLESGYVEGSKVQLHDTVRQMALWITSGEGDGNGNVFLVGTGRRLPRVPAPERWTVARRISLMKNEIGELPDEPTCHNPQTLLLNENKPLRKIADHAENFVF